MRRTEAPASARRRPANGPGARPANSITLIPVRGGGLTEVGDILEALLFSGVLVEMEIGGEVDVE